MDEDSSRSSTTPDSNDGNPSLGIGLAVVARYVRNMNGQIRIRSELGKGTIFGIELPFDHATGTPIATPESRSPKTLPRPLSATEKRISRYNSDDSSSTISPPSLHKQDVLDGDESSSSIDVVLPPPLLDFQPHDFQGSNNVILPEDES